MSKSSRTVLQHLCSWCTATTAFHSDITEQAAQSNALTLRHVLSHTRLLLLHERAESGREAWTAVRKQRAEERAKAALQIGERRVIQDHSDFAAFDAAAC